MIADATYKITDFFKPHPKQKEVLKYVGKGYNIFYGGAKGGGKTDMCIFVAMLSVLQYPQLKVCIVRETYPELSKEIILRILNTYPRKIFKYKFDKRDKIMYFPNGSIITFLSIASPLEVHKLQGIEYQLMIIDEAPNLDEEVIRLAATNLRTSKHPDFIPTLLMTGNPIGKSSYYFRDYYAIPDYSVWSPEELENKDKYVFIQALLQDNPSVNYDEYSKRLITLPAGLRDALLYGIWGGGEGMFFDEWDYNKHTCESFDIPPHWVRKCGFDIGWSNKHPSVALWATQDPETKTVYIYREYIGIGVTEQYAEDMIRLEQGEIVAETYCDPSMFLKGRPQYQNSIETDASIFIRKGKYVMPAINDRILGWRIVKQWLSIPENGEPKLKIFRDKCPYLIKTIPQQRYAMNGRKKDDLDTDGPDDAVDALRYLLVSGFQYPVEGDLTYEEFMKPLNSWDFNRYWINRPKNLVSREENKENISIFVGKAEY